MEIPIIFLGTGQAVPTAKRNHTSILLNYKDESIMIDCGEGTQRQLRKAKINPCKLTKILITHWHGDHILGLPGLLQTLALNNYNKTLKIFGPIGTKKFMEKIFDMFIYEGKIKYEIIEVEHGKFFETPDFILEAEKMFHTCNCLAYSFMIKDKLRIDKKKLSKYKIKGKIISELAKGKDIEWNNKKIKAGEITYFQKGKKITFVLDTAENANMEKLAKNSDLLISEATYLNEEKELAHEYRHLTAKQAAETAKKSNSKKLILIHLSQRYENKEKLILKEAVQVFKNTEIAEDFFQVRV